jgi:hypothetical protein
VCLPGPEVQAVGAAVAPFPARRSWGFAVQLYSVRSRASWGMVPGSLGGTITRVDHRDSLAGRREAGVDPTKPSIARRYDYYKANRAFLGRAVRFLAGQGIRQFLDIGSGIPTVGK